MRKIKMSEVNPPTSADELSKFEISHDIAFPTSYRQFLLDTNGGVPELTAFPVQGRPQNPIDCVQVFSGIGVNWPTTEISYALDLYRGRIPNKLLPIAVQDGGSFICLDLRGESDRVVFWDHRHFWGTGEWREQDLYHIADTFEAFLELLMPYPY